MYRISKPLFGVYVHWPYCLSKCPYCDFFSQAERAMNEEEILKGYQRDILFFAHLKKSYLPITSVFFGGGTLFNVAAIGGKSFNHTSRLVCF